MKKFTFILSIILMAQVGAIYAQDTDVVNFTVTLEDVLNLEVTGGADQTALFNTPATYNFGIDAVGTSTIIIESTTNWNLAIAAPDFSNGGDIIPINNLGVWLEATGTHQFGAEVTSSFTILGSACGVTNVNQTIIDNGTGNNGDATDNAFNLNWTMGTMYGTMNGASMFDQMADGTIGSTGVYTTTATLTLTAE